MREILFRGKRDNNGEWVEGSLFQDIGSGHFMIEYFDYYTDENGLQRDFYNYNVDPETVGQYTGLTDKNGKKIFEGDIIQSVETDETGIVQWFPEHSAFMVWNKSSNKVGFLYECAEISEVIGNIHELKGV